MMKPFLMTFAMVAVVGLFRSAPAAAQDDALALAKHQCAAIEKAFNAHDVPALTALYAEDVDVTVLAGDSVADIRAVHLAGMAEARSVFETLLHEYPGAKLKLTVHKARLAGHDVLVSDQSYEVTGLPAGTAPIKAITFVVRQKHGEKWLVVAERHVAQVPKENLKLK